MHMKNRQNWNTTHSTICPFIYLCRSSFNLKFCGILEACYFTYQSMLKRIFVSVLGLILFIDGKRAFRVIIVSKPFLLANILLWQTHTHSLLAPVKIDQHASSPILPRQFCPSSFDRHLHVTLYGPPCPHPSSPPFLYPCPHHIYYVLFLGMQAGSPAGWGGQSARSVIGWLSCKYSYVPTAVTRE